VFEKYRHYKKNSRISRVFTCEGKTNVLIQHADLLHCAIVLELQNRLLFDSQNHNIGATDTDLKYTHRKSKTQGDKVRKSSSKDHISSETWSQFAGRSLKGRHKERCLQER
jgi:hypothetical protein